MDLAPKSGSCAVYQTKNKLLHLFDNIFWYHALMSH